MSQTYYDAKTNKLQHFLSARNIEKVEQYIGIVRT